MGIDSSVFCERGHEAVGGQREHTCEGRGRYFREAMSVETRRVRLSFAEDEKETFARVTSTAAAAALRHVARRCVMLNRRHARLRTLRMRQRERYALNRTRDIWAISARRWRQRRAMLSQRYAPRRYGGDMERGYRRRSYMHATLSANMRRSIRGSPHAAVAIHMRHKRAAKEWQRKRACAVGSRYMATEHARLRRRSLPFDPPFAITCYRGDHLMRGVTEVVVVKAVLAARRYGKGSFRCA